MGRQEQTGECEVEGNNGHILAHYSQRTVLDPASNAPGEPVNNVDSRAHSRLIEWKALGTGPGNLHFNQTLHMILEH